MARIFGIFLIVLGLGLGLTIAGRALYSQENLEDPSIVPANIIQATSTQYQNQADLEEIAPPERLSIPKIEVDAAVQFVGLTKNNAMANPSNFTDVAWYKYGPVPGTLGSAVMAGHLDNALALDGVFKKLNELGVGDDVYVTDENGRKLHFRVTDVETYAYDNTPSEKIFMANDNKRLNLITYAGKWLKAQKTYDQRLVIYTELME